MKKTFLAAIAAFLLFGCAPGVSSVVSLHKDPHNRDFIYTKRGKTEVWARRCYKTSCDNYTSTIVTVYNPTSRVVRARVSCNYSLESSDGNVSYIDSVVRSKWLNFKPNSKTNLTPFNNIVTSGLDPNLTRMIVQCTLDRPEIY